VPISKNAPAGAVPSTGILPLCFAGLTLILIGFLSVNGLLAVLTNGAVAAAILVASAGLGVCVLSCLRIRELPRRWFFLLSTGLGLGTLSLLMLALGTAGVLSRTVWIVLLSLFAIAGLVQILRALKRPVASPIESASSRRGLWLLFLLVPFAAFALLAATMPPGLLWPAEGNGYDALEYHLGAPRDYLDAGRIEYLPHNIYSNFPFNVEMLYLLAMILHGDPVRAALTCQLLHAMLAIMAVAAIWLAAREVNPTAGLAAALLAGMTPFLVYLSGLAYVEHGLLFFSALALAAALRSLCSPAKRYRWFFAAGLLAGFACGCKYTGVMTTALPLACAVFFGAGPGARRSIADRMKSMLCFSVGAMLAFCPWLLKNFIATGNPVFPLGYSILGAGEGIWNDRLARQWIEGHQPSPEHSGATDRVARFFDQVVVSRYFGPLIALSLAAVPLALILCRTSIFAPPKRGRETPEAIPIGDTRFADTGNVNRLAMHPELACFWMLGVGALAWTVLTHLVDRFAIVLIAPCAVLGGLAWQRLRDRTAIVRPAFGVLLLILLSAFNGVAIWRLFTTGSPSPTERPIDYLTLDVFGQHDLMTREWPGDPRPIPRLNREFRARKRILLVAEARRFYFQPGADYCVVFNRNPFAEAAETRDAAQLMQWLRQKGYDYVYVDWMEMDRLRRTYGFWKSIDVPLFESLSAAGLTPVEQFRVVPPPAPPYATLFRVP